MMMRFPYQRYEVDAAPGFVGVGGVLYRPEIPIRVIGVTGDASFLALVDTGADGTVLPKSVSDAIGATVDMSRPIRVRGLAGQEMQVWLGYVELELRQGDELCRWAATVGFAEFDDPEDEQALLGHGGCLDLLRVTFDGQRHELEIEPTERLADASD